jgi:pimeloyl-ACP methyl ester carboxylesterase
MKAKQIPSAHFIGNSMGGALALTTTIYAPERVRSLTLIDALGYPLALPLPLLISKIMGSFIKPFQSKFLVRKTLEQIMYDPSKVTDEQVEEYFLPFRIPGGTKALIATLRNFDDSQLEKMAEKFSDIHVPILVIWGEKDKWIPLSQYEHFLKDFPKAERLLIPNCGHIPQEECPHEVVEAIIKFLSTSLAKF